MKIEYNYKNLRIILTLIIVVLFLSVGFPIVFEETTSQKEIIINNNYLLILGLIISFILSFSIFFILLKIIELCILLFKKNPAIIITDKYIIDNSRYYSFGKIPWSEIKHLNLVTPSSGRKYIELHLDTEFYTLVKLNKFKKILLWFDHYGNKSIVYLRGTFVNCNMDEIASVYNNYKK